VKLGGAEVKHIFERAHDLVAITLAAETKLIPGQDLVIEIA
jgi:hypothetical protein